MIEPRNLGTYFGFTKEEVWEECQKHGVDYEEMKRWYDGYQLDTLSVYNPKSVVNFLYSISNGVRVHIQCGFQ